MAYILTASRDKIGCAHARARGTTNTPLVEKFTQPVFRPVCGAVQCVCVCVWIYYNCTGAEHQSRSRRHRRARNTFCRDFRNAQRGATRFCTRTRTSQNTRWEIIYLFFFFSSVFHFLLLLSVFSFAFRGVRPRTTYGSGRFFASSPNHLAPGSRIVIAHKPVVNRIRRASGSPCSRDFSITRYSPPLLPRSCSCLSFLFSSAYEYITFPAQIRISCIRITLFTKTRAGRHCRRNGVSEGRSRRGSDGALVVGLPTVRVSSGQFRFSDARPIHIFILFHGTTQWVYGGFFFFYIYIWLTSFAQSPSAFSRIHAKAVSVNAMKYTRYKGFVKAGNYDTFEYYYSSTR